MTTMFKLTFNKPTSVCYFKADGGKVTYTLPRNPQTDTIVTDIHSTNPEAVIFMHRESDGRIHIVPGKNPMSNNARNALMTEVDAWLSGLDAARYSGKKDTASFGSGCANGGCIIQPPKKEKLNATLKADTRAAILSWTQHATTTTPGAAPTPAGTPASGTPAGGGTPAGAPAGKTPAPASKTPAPAPAPAPFRLSHDGAAGVNSFREAFELLGGEPVSWKKGERV